MDGTPAPVICPSGERVMVVSFFIGLGWNTVNKGSNWKYLIGFGLAHPGTRKVVWTRAIVPLAMRLAAPAAVVAADIATVGKAALGTTTVQVVAAAGLGYAIGATATTIGVSVAEEKGIVYEGATADVIDLYLPGGAGGKEWVEVVAPALVTQAGTYGERKQKQTFTEGLLETGLTIVLGPVWGPAYSFFRKD